MSSEVEKDVEVLEVSAADFQDLLRGFPRCVAIGLTIGEEARVVEKV